MPMFVSERDFLHRRKIWKSDNRKKAQYLVYSASTETKLFPERRKFIRGEVPISGFYAEEISSEPLKIKFVAISQTDLKVFI